MASKTMRKGFDSSRLCQLLQKSCDEIVQDSSLAKSRISGSA